MQKGNKLCQQNHYYELSLALLRRGGLIAVDNVLRNGEVIELDKQDRNIQAIR